MSNCLNLTGDFNDRNFKINFLAIVLMSTYLLQFLGGYPMLGGISKTQHQGNPMLHEFYNKRIKFKPG